MDGDSLGVLAANKDLTLVFIAQISHYKKFTALHKLTSIVLQLTNQVSISREIMRWQGYFLKTALGTRLILRVILLCHIVVSCHYHKLCNDWSIDITFSIVTLTLEINKLWLRIHLLVFNQYLLMTCWRSLKLTWEVSPLKISRNFLQLLCFDFGH